MSPAPNRTSYLQPTRRFQESNYQMSCAWNRQQWSYACRVPYRARRYTRVMATDFPGCIWALTWKSNPDSGFQTYWTPSGPTKDRFLQGKWFASEVQLTLKYLPAIQRNRALSKETVEIVFPPVEVHFARSKFNASNDGFIFPTPVRWCIHFLYGGCLGERLPRCRRTVHVTAIRHPVFALQWCISRWLGEFEKHISQGLSD